MKSLIFFFIIVFFISCNTGNETSKANEVAARGEELFTLNCSNCHKPNVDYLGPALKGAALRWASKELLYAFIKNPEEVIQQDKYALQLQRKYGSVMSPFPDLSNSQIDAILAYCNK